MHRSSAILAAMISLFTGLHGVHALSVGDEAPRLSAVDQDGRAVDLAEVYSRGPTLVYFYPKAGTPGCTAQACSLRDSFPEFSAEGVQIIGVSADTAEAQKKFAAEHRLPFPLLADTDLAVAKAFGVPTIPVLGVPHRQSFLVVDGKVAWIVRSAKTGDHAAEVQEALRQTAGGKKP